MFKQLATIKFAKASTAEVMKFFLLYTMLESIKFSIKE